MSKLEVVLMCTCGFNIPNNVNCSYNYFKFSSITISHSALYCVHDFLYWFYFIWNQLDNFNNSERVSLKFKNDHKLYAPNHSHFLKHKLWIITPTTEQTKADSVEFAPTSLPMSLTACCNIICIMQTYNSKALWCKYHLKDRPLARG